MSQSSLPSGSHSLRYLLTVASWPNLREPRFIAIGYVDNTQFGCFDSYAENPRAEPRALWVEQEGPDYWEQQTRIAKHWEQIFQVRLRNLCSYYNQSEGGE